MKMSIKQSSIAMAASASLYLVFKLLVQVPAIMHLIRSSSVLAYLPNVALLVGMMMMGWALYENAHQLPVLSKSLRWQAYGLMAVIGCMTLYNSCGVGRVEIDGMLYFYWRSSWIQLPMIVWAVAWLWQYAYLPAGEQRADKRVGVLGVILAAAASLALVLMLVSYVHVLATGHVAGFRSGTWMSWLRPMALLVMLGAYVLGERKAAIGYRVSDNGCRVSDKEDVQCYSKASRTMALVSVIVVAVLVVVGTLVWMSGTLWDWQCDYDVEGVYWITVFGAVHLLWICSVIAMLMDPAAKRWQRVVNVIAPIQINALVVFILLAEEFIPIHVMAGLPSWLKNDLSFGLLVTGLLFLVVVWVMNTAMVLRAEKKLRKKQVVEQTSAENSPNE